MPFTAAWDETAPDGSVTAANTIDTIFKNLKRDIRERLSEILGGDFTDDPIIDGTILKNIATIVAELGNKTTVTGLTTGQLIQATGAGTIGNATNTNAQLAAIVSPLITTAAVTGSGGSSGESSGPTVHTFTKTGFYIATIWAECEAQGVGGDMIATLYQSATFKSKSIAGSAGNGSTTNITLMGNCVATGTLSFDAGGGPTNDFTGRIFVIEFGT